MLREFFEPGLELWPLAFPSPPTSLTKLSLLDWTKIIPVGDSFSSSLDLDPLDCAETPEMPDFLDMPDTALL